LSWDCCLNREILPEPGFMRFMGLLSELGLLGLLGEGNTLVILKSTFIIIIVDNYNLNLFAELK